MPDPNQQNQGGSRTKAVSRAANKVVSRRPAAGRAEQARSAGWSAAALIRQKRPGFKAGPPLIPALPNTSGRFGLLVHGGFGYLSQKSVGLLFLFESLIKKPNGIVQANSCAQVLSVP